MSIHSVDHSRLRLNIWGKKCSTKYVYITYIPFSPLVKLVLFSLSFLTALRIHLLELYCQYIEIRYQNSRTFSDRTSFLLRNGQFRLYSRASIALGLLAHYSYEFLIYCTRGAHSNYNMYVPNYSHLSNLSNGRLW